VEKGGHALGLACVLLLMAATVHPFSEIGHPLPFRNDISRVEYQWWAYGRKGSRSDMTMGTSGQAGLGCIA
jgi:hypothetical protein